MSKFVFTYKYECKLGKGLQETRISTYLVGVRKIEAEQKG